MCSACTQSWISGIKSTLTEFFESPVSQWCENTTVCFKAIKIWYDYMRKFGRKWMSHCDWKMANLPAEETGSDPSICILTSRNKKRIPIVPPSIAELRASVEMNVPHQIRPPETPEEMLTSDFASLNCTEPEIGYETSMQLECELGNSTCCVPSGCSFDIQHNYNRSKSYRFCEMASYQERLRTFATWPLRSPLGRDLAAANMFYQGDFVHNGERIIDQVYCFKCGQPIRGWQADDHPVVEHQKIFLGCFYTKWVEEQ